MRDGGYYNSWDFSHSFAEKYITSTDRAGVDIVELGFRCFSPNYGSFAYTTDSYLSRLTLPKRAKISVMVNASDLINFEGGIYKAVDNLFQDKRLSPVDIVRVAIHLREIEHAGDILTSISAKGYRTMINLMQISRASNSEITEIASMLSEHKDMEVLYFADSLGNMGGADIERCIGAIRGGWPREIGIHAHNNMEQANANSMVAVNAGVTWVDATLQGMGRGAGNAKTEVLIRELQKTQGKQFTSDSLFSIVMNEVENLKQQYHWGPSELYYYSALENIHPTYVQHMLIDLDLEPDNVMEILKELCGGENYSFSIKNLNKAILSAENK